MAQTVHLKLEIDGIDIEGESTKRGFDREHTIECSSLRHEVVSPRDPASFQTTGKRQHSQVTISKRIDKSTPLLLKALCNNETVNRAEFRFFRVALGGRTTTVEEQFYTVLLENGNISAVRQLSEDAIVGGEDAPPMMEEVSFTFQDITWTYEIGGATHSDSV